MTSTKTADIRRRLTSSFLPLDCRSEVFDYDFRLRFAVFNNDGKKIAEVADIVIRDIEDEDRLDAVIALLRREVAEQGYHLDPFNP